MFEFIRGLRGRFLKNTNARVRRVGRMWRARLELEPLHARILPSVTPGAFQNSLGRVVIQGTDAEDTVVVSGGGGQVVVSFNDDVYLFNEAGVTGIRFYGYAGDDFFVNTTAIATVVKGGLGADNLIGGDGHDRLLGQGGADFISGGAGDDALSGGIGDDELYGDDGDDLIDGNLGDDTEDGGEGDDTLNGNGGDDYLSGGLDDDVLNGGIDNDIADGETGNDTLKGALGYDDLSGDEGDDLIYGGLDEDIADGGTGEDSLNGGGGDDALSGADDDDLLNGGAGADALDGEEGDDALNGGLNNDALGGGTGDDALNGGAGDDELDGGLGADALDGGDGWDTIDSDGDDTNAQGEFEGIFLELTAALTGPGAAVGAAEYDLEQGDDGTEADLEVEIEGAAAGATFDVFVDDIWVGQITTNKFGHGELGLSDSALVPDVSDGSVLTISDVGGDVILQGTFGSQDE